MSGIKQLVCLACLCLHDTLGLSCSTYVMCETDAVQLARRRFDPQGGVVKGVGRPTGTSSSWPTNRWQSQVSGTFSHFNFQMRKSTGVSWILYRICTTSSYWGLLLHLPRKGIFCIFFMITSSVSKANPSVRRCDAPPAFSLSLSLDDDVKPSKAIFGLFFLPSALF